MKTITLLSAILLLLTASPLPTKKTLPNADQESTAGALGLEKRVGPGGIKSFISTSVPFSPNVKPISDPPSVSPVFEQNLLKDQHSALSFKQVLNEASLRKDLTLKGHYLLAFRTHDPTKDDYEALQIFLEMKPSKDKDEWKKIIQDDMRFKQFYLDKLLAWKGSFKPTTKNLDIAIKMADPDMITYFIARGVKPSRTSLSLAIKNGDLAGFKVLASKVEPNEFALHDAINYDKHEFIEYLVKEWKIFPNQDHLHMGIEKQTIKTIRYLVEEGGYTPTAHDLTYARRSTYPNQDIITYLTEMKDTLKFLSVSFNEAENIALHLGVSNDQAKVLAYRSHNPSKDDYSIFRKWKKMDNLDPEKEELEKNMWKNPTLQKFLKWELRGFDDPTRTDLFKATQQENIDLFEYWSITREFKPAIKDLILAIRIKSPVMVEYFIKKGVQTSKVHLNWAIQAGNLKTVQALVEQRKYPVTEGDLKFARAYRNEDIIDYLEKQLEFQKQTQLGV